MDEMNTEPGTKRIELVGEYKVEQSSKLKGELLDAVQKCSLLKINMDRVEEVDLTFIQLICSIHRENKARNIDIGLESRLPECVSKILHQAGYFLCCQRCPVKQCFLREALSND